MKDNRTDSSRSPVMPDRAEAEKFLAALDPTSTRFTFQTFDDDKTRKDNDLVRIIHGSLAEKWKELVLLNARGAGIFVTVNETNGKGRKAENIVRVRALFVDLDGSPLDPVLAGELTPHIVVESSPERWHAYWKIDGLPLNKFGAIQKSLLKRFGGDPAVIDLPRVMRLPGFVHQKDAPVLVRVKTITDLPSYDEDHFKAAEPEPEPQPEPEPNDDDDSTADAVWLAAMLKVIPNDDLEWKDWNDVIMAVWASTSGSEVGFDLAETWSKKSKKYDATEMRARWEEMTRSPPKRTGVNKLRSMASKADPRWRAPVKLGDFIAYRPMHSYIFRPTREFWPAASVNAHVGEVTLKKPKRAKVPKGKKPESATLPKEKNSIAASSWLDVHSFVEQMTWAPGEPELIRDKLISNGGWFDRKGSAVFNLYRPPTLVPRVGNVDRWRNHIVKLYGEVQTRYLELYLAYKVQHPGGKINHSVVMIGNPGTGKDTILEPVRQAVGPWNFGEASPTELMGSFNPFAKSVVLRINEAYDQGEFDRYSLYHRLKAYEAAPPVTLPVNEKHIRPYYIPNVVAVIITSNRIDALHLPPDDRRHLVLTSNVIKDDFSRGYFDDMYRWYDDGGSGHVAYYLTNLDLSEFNAKEAPVKTEGFWAVVSTSVTSEDVELGNVLEALGTPDVVTLDMVKAKIETESFYDWFNDRKNFGRIPHRFEKCGYVRFVNQDREDGAWVIDKKRRQVYAKKNLSYGAGSAAIRELDQKPHPVSRRPMTDQREPHGSRRASS